MTHTKKTLCSSPDNVAQRSETQVDGCALLESVSLRARQPLSLAAGKVHQVNGGLLCDVLFGKDLAVMSRDLKMSQTQGPVQRLERSRIYGDRTCLSWRITSMCERLLLAFMWVAAVVRVLVPCSINCST